MAKDLSDVLSPEGQVPSPGDNVGIWDSISAGKAVVILGAGALGGLAVLRMLQNQAQNFMASGPDGIDVIGGL